MMAERGARTSAAPKKPSGSVSANAQAKNTCLNNEFWRWVLVALV